ncbi:MAG TPA: sugar transferase [Terriglobales bacterium]|nr:sugar transferase [Terriglobales bacterium]
MPQPEPVQSYVAVESGIHPVESTFHAAAVSVVRRSKHIHEQLYEISKRVIDVLVSLSSFVIGSPVFLLVSMLVMLTSPGSVLFRQKRLGRNGTEFCCYKFRTMVNGAYSELDSNPELRKRFEEHYKLEQDPRVTRLGAFLRSSSLDEMPQFWNVLVGDMTLIGPRPIVPPELVKYGPQAAKLLSVRPGLSGLWQACGRSKTTYGERIDLDMLYIDHRSFSLDVTLILRTIGVVVKRIGAC